MIDFNQGRFSSVSSSSSTAGGRQTLNELEGRMELGIELGEEVEEDAHLSPAYRSESCTESWIMSRTTLASQVIVMNCKVGVDERVATDEAINIWKLYVNCGVKNYMKVDHRSYRRIFRCCEEKAWKKKSGLYGIRTLDLCDTGASLCQLS